MVNLLLGQVGCIGGRLYVAQTSNGSNVLVIIALDCVIFHTLAYRDTSDTHSFNTQGSLVHLLTKRESAARSADMLVRVTEVTLWIDL